MQKDLLPLAARVKREKAKKAISRAMLLLFYKRYIYFIVCEAYLLQFYIVCYYLHSWVLLLAYLSLAKTKISVYQFLLVIIVSMHVQIDNKKNNSNKKID